MKEPKVIIDSNVLVSILKGSKGLSFLYKAFKQERFKLIISSEIIKELAAVLYRPRFKIAPKDIKELFKLIKMKAIRVKPRFLNINVCRDPEDNFILELALEAKADFIVTGDKDLLILKAFRKIPIVTPKEFIKRLKE